MNLITFSFSEKGTPVFLNQEPFSQVGTLYLMKAGKNSVIGITLDDSVVKLAKAPGRKPRKAKAEKVEPAPKKRGRKPKSEATVAAPKKRARKPAKPRAKKEKTEKKTEGAA